MSTTTTGGTEAFTAQIVGNYLHNSANEAELTLIRVAYSPIIKESFDCSAAILGADSLYWGQADTIPLQLGVLAPAHEMILGEYGGDLVPGMILLSNDPRVGAPHLNDFVAIAPVFVEDRPVAAIATLAHYTDVGGKVPGSMPADATELFQEGFCLPPVPIAQGHEIDRTMLGLLRANSRTPENLEADLRAQVAACHLGVTRVREAADRYGIAELEGLIGIFLDHSERLARQELARLRPGTYTASRMLDCGRPDDADAWVSATVTIDDEGVLVDWSESCDQIRRPLNVVPSNGYSAALCALRCVLGTSVPFNGGVQRLLRTTSRAGSVMNPNSPAPVGARAVTAVLAYQCVLDALGQATDGLAAASSSGGTTMPVAWAPVSQPGRVMIDNSLTGGTGARRGAEGLPATENSVTNATNVSVEMLEQDFPVVVDRYEVREDSGGDGRWRGGHGTRRIWRFLEPGTLFIRGWGDQYAPQGMGGGAAGAPSRFLLDHEGVCTELPGQKSGIPVLAGDRLIAETPGGGGFGDPADATDGPLIGSVTAEQGGLPVGPIIGFSDSSSTGTS